MEGGQHETGRREKESEGERQRYSEEEKKKMRTKKQGELEGATLRERESR